MPRKRNTVPNSDIDVYLPTSLLKAVDDRLYDARLGRAAYGARSELITRLLYDWIKANPLNPHIQKIKDKEAADAAESL